jgi:hypothetical protein
MFAAAFAMTALTAQSLRQREVRPQDLPRAGVFVEGLIVAPSSARSARAADSWSYRRWPCSADCRWSCRVAPDPRRRQHDRPRCRVLRRRGVCVALFVVGSIAALAWWSIKAEFVLEALRTAVQTELSAASGTNVSIARLSIGAQGIVLEKVVVHAGKLSGARPPILSVGRVLLVFDWWSLLQRAEARLDGVELEHVDAALGSLRLALDSAVAASSGSADGPTLTTWSRIVARALDAGVRWCRVYDLNVAAPAGPMGEMLQLFGGELVCERHDRRLAVELNAKRLVYDGSDAGSLRVQATADASKLELQNLDLRAASARGWARGELRWAQAPASFALAGGLELRSDSLVRALRGLVSLLPEGVAVGAPRAVAAFDVHGPVGDVKRWSGQGRVVLTRPAVRIPGARSALNLDALYFEGQYGASGLRLDAIRAHGAGLQVKAQLEVLDVGTRVLSGSLSLSELEVLRRMLPEHLWPRRLHPRLRALDGRIHLTAKLRWTDELTELSGQLQGAGLVLDGAGGAKPILLSHFATRFEARPTRASQWLRLSEIVLRGPAGVIHGRARLSRGVHHAELTVGRLDGLALSDVLPGSIERGTLSGSLTIDGSVEEPLRRLSGNLQVREALWRLPAAPLSFALPGAVADVEIRRGSASLSRDPAGWRFAELIADGSVRIAGTAHAQDASIAGKMRGEVTIGERRHHAELELEQLDARILNAALPGAMERGALRGSFVVDSGPDLRQARLAGRIELSDAGWRPPSEVGPFSFVGIRRATAEVERRADGWQLSNVRVDSTEGELRGELYWQAGGHRGFATFEPARTSALAALVPGRLDPGSARISADVQGTKETPLKRIRGRILLQDARWTLPVDAGLCTSSLSIHRASADYSWRPGELRLSKVDIKATSFGATAEVSWSPRITRIDARLTTRSAGKLLDLFPELSELVHGGHGSAVVQVRVAADGISGLVEGRVENGLLAVASVSGARRTRHPIEKARFEYTFGPRRRRIQGLKIRGPELNVDLDATWSEHGPMTGWGRLWLTRRYTEQVTHGAGWALALLGYPRIETEFTLSGTRRDVRMDAEITHGWRWRLLRIAVPDRLEKIGRGGMPVFRAADSPRAGCRP